MNAVIPYYNLNSKQKKIIISANQKLYKNIHLNDIQIITGYSKKYIIYLLSTHRGFMRPKHLTRLSQNCLTKLNLPLVIFRYAIF